MGPSATNQHQYFGIAIVARCNAFVTGLIQALSLQDTMG